MGTYKANRNEDIETPEKTQEEIDFEKNKNTSEKIAQGVGMYFGGQAGGEIAKIATKTKAGQMITDQAANIITKNKVLNKVSTELNDSGVVDAAGQAMDMMGSSSGGGAGSIPKVPNTSTTNSVKPETLSNQKSSNLLENSSGSNSSSGSNLDLGKMTDMFSISKLAKIKIIAISSFAFIIMMLFFGIGASAQKDFFNLALTNNTVLASKGGKRTCTPSEIESKVIYVGDSRTEGLRNALSNSNATFIAQSGQGYNWLKDTASAEIDSKLTENPSALVVFSLGVNDTHNVNNYVSYYREFQNKYPSAKFYIMSVNPVDEGVATSNGYSQTNTAIEEFNNVIKSEFTSNYLDVYSSIKDNISTSDGLHYTNETYQKINDFVLSSLSTSSGIYCGASADVIGQLESVGRWYIENVKTYQNSTSGKGSGSRKYYQTPFGSRAFGDDCTEFVNAYMSYVCGIDLPESYSGDMVDPNGSWAQTAANCNWKAYTSDEVGTLQSGDVLIAHSGFSHSTKGQHAEVYISENETFGWGKIQKNYPLSNKITTTNEGGHVHFKDGGHDYITVYRYEGATTTSDPNITASDLNITKMTHPSFNHGTKPKSNQKYIMLHDTEMKGDATAVYNAWKNSNNGVAAHFIVNRDGSIVQAGELDTIIHHAGWGGPGNFDQKFGVGNNDGLGNGDDLVGTSKVGYDSYTSYGMNSYSIGIEMCHVNGEDYPEAQLNAVDKLIQYIDSYYGFQSKIIDHKDWRPSNSDTDAKFASYLNNYKNIRHH